MVGWKIAKRFAERSRLRLHQIKLHVITLSKARGRAVYKENEAFSIRQDAYFRIDLRLSFRQEFKGSTLGASLDLQDLTAKMFSLKITTHQIYF